MYFCVYAQIFIYTVLFHFYFIVQYWSPSVCFIHIASNFNTRSLTWGHVTMKMGQILISRVVIKGGMGNGEMRNGEMGNEYSSRS